MGNCVSTYPSCFTKDVKELPIHATFNVPSTLPTWPIGGRFASGTIDLGGVITTEVTTFNKVWATYEGGPDNKGATFFEPIGLPNGYSLLGYYAQPNNQALFGRVVVAKDNAGGASPALRGPTDYALVWSSKSLNVKEDINGYIWAPIPSDGYQAVGLVVTTTPDKPPLDKIMCVRSDLTSSCETNELIWGRQGGANSNEFNIFESRPVSTWEQAYAVRTGTFIARSGSNGANIGMHNIVCLKNTLKPTTYMPNLEQIKALINTYAPRIYNHPDEQYLPSSVEWFFSNGALLYKKGEESNPVSIDPTGSILPQGGTTDGLYWIDLPRDKNAREKVMRGDIVSANGYFHIKPVSGGTYTDIAIWLFYPFNGGSTAKVGIFKVPLGKIGEHVGDWEHVTLRISNFDGVLTKVFFSQHAGGEWVDAPNLEYLDNTNRFIVYASLHGHAAYAHPGDVLQGTELIGIRNDTAKSDNFLDTTKDYSIISADFIEGVTEPPWLNYARKWGPTIDYNVDDEVLKVAKVLPGKLKTKFVEFVKSLPAELLGEEGPTGPKMKKSWDGEETTK
ncbi:hypothetical protein vseg_009925 [Gypsophila vaccaria]